MSSEAGAGTPSRARWRSGTVGELVAEFLGTFVLIAFGDGVVAMAVAALNQSGRGTQIFQASGDWLLITWGWALAVTFGVYVAGGVTGAHINPAVTLSMALRRGFPWRKVPGYWLAQLVGAFVGAALVYLVYHSAISSYEQVHQIVRSSPAGNTTFSIFATFPAPYFHGSLVGPLVDQIVGTAFLVLFVLALTDARNLAPQSNLGPFLVGLAVAAIGMSYGANAGYAINPARDLGPRFEAWLQGWGHNAFGGISGYWWVPIVGPLIGAVIAPFIYDFLILGTLVGRGEPVPAGVEERGRALKDEETAAPQPTR